MQSLRIRRQATGKQDEDSAETRRAIAAASVVFALESDRQSPSALALHRTNAFFVAHWRAIATVGSTPMLLHFRTGNDRSDHLRRHVESGVAILDAMALGYPRKIRVKHPHVAVFVFGDEETHGPIEPRGRI